MFKVVNVHRLDKVDFFVKEKDAVAKALTEVKQRGKGTRVAVSNTENDQHDVYGWNDLNA